MTPPPLTLRKWEVVSLLVLGHSYKAIGRQLGISWRTVERHVVQIAHTLPGDAPPCRRVLAHASLLLRARVDHEADAA